MMNSMVLFGLLTSAGLGGSVVVEAESMGHTCFVRREAAYKEEKRARGEARATENTKEKPENNQDKTEQEQR